METVLNTHAPDDARDAPLLASNLKVRRDLRFGLSQRRGKCVYLIEDAIRVKYFHVGTIEFHFVRRLDGGRTVADAIELTKAQFPNETFGSEQAVGVCQWLIQSNLVHCDSPAMTHRLIAQANQLTTNRRLSCLNPLFLRVPFAQPNAVIKRLTPWVDWLFSSWFLVLWLVLAGVAIHCLFEHWQRISENSFGIFAPNRLIWMIVGGLALKLVHETAHAVACRKFGGDIGTSGVQFILFVPLPFVDVTSSWRFRNRWQRIVVSAAGMYVELAITFLAIIVWVQQPAGLVADLCYNLFVISGVTTLLFNANPLMKFDGYYIVSDLLEVPNLYQRGQESVRRWAAWLFLGAGRPPQFESIRDAILISAYGFASLTWRLVLSISILLVASTLFQGAGIAMATVAALMWYGPVILSIRKLLIDRKQINQLGPVRVAVSAAILAGVALSLAAILASPARKSAACIVQFKNEQVLRAPCDGFITAIHLRDGQSIEPGQILLELDNQDLRLELGALESKAAHLKLKIRSYQAAGLLTDCQSAQAELEGLELQLGEKREQINQMQVRSPIEGFINRVQLDDLVGSFVHQGDPIAIVSAFSSKEIRVSVSQSDLASIKHNVGHRVAVVLPGIKTFRATLSSLDPRASDVPLHMSLGACYGGPLAVHEIADRSRPDESQYELLTPCFAATIDLDATSSKLVQSGQRGIVILPMSRESIGTNLYLRCRRWVYRKLGWHVI